MLKGSTAHRAYILEVDRDAQGTKERVTLLVDYGRNQARVEKVVAGLTRKNQPGRDLPWGTRRTRACAHRNRAIASWTSLDV
jgi:hypothetical protein